MVVERQAFRGFCATMDQKFIIPSRQHLAIRIIPDTCRSQDGISRVTAREYTLCFSDLGHLD